MSKRTQSSVQGSTVVVVAHDAGGGEIVSSWVRRNPGGRFVVFAEGPSREVFSRKGIETEPRTDLPAISAAIQQADWVLTGTGTLFEKGAIEEARSRSVYVVAFLDHWIKYRRRFLLGGELVLPDEIWVGDRDALAIAQRKFRGTKVSLVCNPYLADIVGEIEAQKTVRTDSNGQLNILYLAQPIGGHALDHRRSGIRPFDAEEFQTLEWFLCGVDEYVRSIGYCMGGVRVRRHPSEPVGKYASVLAHFGHLNIEETGQGTLVEDCVWSDWVVGFETMAMVVAQLAGRRVLSLGKINGKSTIPRLSDVDLWPPFVVEGRVVGHSRD